MNILNPTYYVILHMPFETILVYGVSFSNLQDALEVLTELPWFTIWDETQLSSWQGRIVVLPSKHKQKQHVYVFTSGKKRIAIAAKNPVEAHRQLFNKHKQTGVITAKREVLSGKQYTKGSTTWMGSRKR